MRWRIPIRGDQPTRKTLAQFVRRFHRHFSKVVHDWGRLLVVYKPREGRREIIGQGKFASYIGDLASNKEHLKDFGR